MLHVLQELGSLGPTLPRNLTVVHLDQRYSEKFVGLGRLLIVFHDEWVHRGCLKHRKHILLVLGQLSRLKCALESLAEIIVVFGALRRCLLAVGHVQA